MENIAGYVEHIVFRNEENGYTVFYLSVSSAIKADDFEITCTGNLHYISEGEAVELTGEYVHHPEYGKQFRIESYEYKTPEDEMAIERYLGSGAIKGIGAALAARIVRRFGKDTFRIVEEEPERLSEIKGISERMAREIANQIEDKKDMRQAMIFLQQYGISTNLSAKIYQQYGADIYKIIRENPYKLADDVQGVGFRIADEIATKAGIHMDSDFRVRSGLVYELLAAGNEGHTYLPMQELLMRTQRLLSLDSAVIEQQISNLCMEKKIVAKNNGEEVRVYSSQYYYMELGIAKMLSELNLHYSIEEEAFLRTLRTIEKEDTVCLDLMQKDAVKAAVKHGVMILTGGPGTGKTTTINTMIRFFEKEGLNIRLAAPTGRAAKRMSETTGIEAQTIHRMLELSGGQNEDTITGFERNEQNPLEEDVIIIDEMSMVDIHLMSALLKAIVPGTRLILVGDVNQLPSVGPGCVLKDLIDSDCFCVVRLNKIFRQAAESDIIVNAHKINQGEMVTLDNKSRDFFFLKRYDTEVIIGVMLTLIQKKLPKYINAAPFDIQVLSPTRKGPLGIERLNKILQQYLNPPAKNKKEKEYGQGLFREGDKVMQIKNNYQLEWEVCNKYGIPVEKGVGIFNGDMGIVKEINLFAETMTILYDENRKTEYSFKQLDELELAYAVTIHKAQGSEYPAVIIPLFGNNTRFLTRNLLYTGVTRARDCVTIVGDEHLFYHMESNVREQERYSGLRERLKEVI